MCHGTGAGSSLPPLIPTATTKRLEIRGEHVSLSVTGCQAQETQRTSKVLKVSGSLLKSFQAETPRFLAHVANSQPALHMSTTRAQLDPVTTQGTSQ